MEKFNLKKLNDIDSKERYGVRISNRIAALEKLGDYVDIKRAWETIREKTKLQPKRV
jgi:hypothetical protein